MRSQALGIVESDRAGLPPCLLNGGDDEQTFEALRGASGAGPASAVRLTKAFEGTGDPFTGELLTADFGPVRICHVLARQHEDGRPHVHHSYRDTPYSKIVFQLQGSAELSQGDRRTLFHPGAWSIYDVSRPYAMRNIKPLEQLVLLLPRDGHSAELERLVRELPDEPASLRGMGRVLFKSAHSALLECAHMGAPARESLGDGLVELARIALQERFGKRSRIPVKSTVRERIERHVLRNLPDHDLSVEAIAAAFDCSKRYLHKVFAESGTTLSGFIWDKRLERCRRDLADPVLANRSITEIAFNWGYVNSAHFSRSFRERFGLSPRDYRRVTCSTQRIN